MTGLLIKLVEKKDAASKRDGYGILSGFTGIICNIILCIAKFVIGSLTGAVSVTADAVNNLSDATVNVVTIIGTKLAGKPVDKEHPFGHGRIEYVSALIVSLSIFLMSFELAKSSVQKIIRPEKVEFSYVYLIVLGGAVLVKLWMAYFNGRLYKITDNLNLKAVMKDSLNDCIATLVTAVALVLSGVFGISRIDGIAGLGVAVFVFLSGVGIVKDILGPLLGEPPSKEVTDRIYDIILSDELILGVHDLIVHNYGPGRIIASAHAEVPSDTDLVTVHDSIDRAEKEIMSEFGIDICIHTDPVSVTDSELEKYKTLTEIIIGDYNGDFTFHDFRLFNRGGEKSVSFDLVTPFEYENEREKIAEDITKLYGEMLPEIKLNINVEHSYI